MLHTAFNSTIFKRTCLTLGLCVLVMAFGHKAQAQKINYLKFGPFVIDFSHDSMRLLQPAMVPEQYEFSSCHEWMPVYTDSGKLEYIVNFSDWNLPGRIDTVKPRVWFPSGERKSVNLTNFCAEKGTRSGRFVWDMALKNQGPSRMSNLQYPMVLQVDSLVHDSLHTRCVGLSYDQFEYEAGSYAYVNDSTILNSPSITFINDHTIPNYMVETQFNINLFNGKSEIFVDSIMAFELVDSSYISDNDTVTFLYTHITPNHHFLYYYFESYEWKMDGTSQNGRNYIHPYNLQRNCLVRLKLDEQFRISGIEKFPEKPHKSLFYSCTNDRNLRHAAMVHSPNDRFLYLGQAIAEDSFRRLNLLQIDVATRDTTLLLDTIVADFQGFSYGPDGALYFMACYDQLPATKYRYGLVEITPKSSVYLGRIPFPDKPGKKCLANPFYKNVAPYLKDTCMMVSVPIPYHRMPKFSMWESCDNHQNRIAVHNTSSDEFTKFTWHVLNKDSSTVLTDTNRYNPQLVVPDTGWYYVVLEGTTALGATYKKWHYDRFHFDHDVKAGFELKEDTVCRWTPITLTDKTTNTNNLTSHKWKIMHTKDSFVITNTTLNPSVQFTDTGYYSIERTVSTKYCHDTVRKDSVVFAIDAPKPGFSLSDTFGCTPLEVAIHDSSKGHIMQKHYSWTSTDSISDPVRSITFDKSGYYRVAQTVKGPTGCENHDTQHVQVQKGLSAQVVPEILYASVVADNTAKIKWKPIEGASNYLLKRTSIPDTQLFSLLNALVDSFIDSSIFSNKRSYTYELIAFDSCKQATNVSNIGTTLHLSVENQNNEFAVLSWNAYQNWQFGISEYAIESSLDQQQWYPIDASRQLQYPDYRIPQLPTDTVYYRIVAYEQSGNNQKALSNVVSLPIYPTLFVPNAFSPNGDGVNDIFKVKGIGITDFACQIFAKNGQIIARSSNPDRVWDGTRLGQPLPVGEYQYIIHAKGSKGEEIDISGRVMVIR